MSKFLYYLSIIILCSLQLYSAALQSPKNAIYDPINSRYLITQSNNQLVALDNDMLNAEFILSLDSPAELFIQSSKLYIADINKILVYKLSNMEQIARYDLNPDLKIKSITGDGNEFLFIANANDNKIYKLSLTNSELTEIIVSSNTISVADLDYMNQALYCAVAENNTSKVLKYDLQSITTELVYSNSSLVGINCIANDNNSIYAYYYGSGINKGQIAQINPLTKTASIIKSNLAIYSSLEYSEELQSLIISQTSNNALSLLFVGIAGKPNLIYPLNNSSIEENMVVFKWDKIPGIAAYNFSISTDSTFTEFVRSYSFQTNQSSIVILDTSEVYFWRVCGVNLGVSGKWSDTFKFKTGNMTYSTPELLSPAANATNIDLSPTFIWTKSLAGIYALQISKIVDFSSIVYEVTNLTDTTYSLSESLSPNTEYFWRVRAYSSLDNPIKWSNQFAFSTFNTPPASPELYYPPNNVVNVSKTPTLEWNTVSNTKFYDVWLSDIIDFPDTNTWKFEVEAKPHTPKQTISIADTLKNTWYYYWKVRAKNDLGIGQWSDTWAFITFNSGGNPGSIADKLDEIKAYPIPAADYVYAEIPFENLTEFKLSLYNSAGISIDLPNYEVMNQDSLIRIPIVDLSAGMYYIIIKSSEKSYLLKFVKN